MVPIAQVVERPPREREIAGSKPGRAIPKALKMAPVATLLGAQHYKASTSSSHSQLTLHKKKKKKKNYVRNFGLQQGSVRDMRLNLYVLYM